jgi:hypothetical protein
MSELISQTQLQDVIVNGSEILQSSALRVDKALTVGNSIINAIQQEGMNAEIDERCNKFLVNCRNAKSDIETQRKPITAFFDNIRKQFTETEGKLDTKKASTIPFIIQGYRDAYAKKIRDDEEAKRREAQEKLEKENETVEVKASIEKRLSEYVQNHILERKLKLQASFNGITLQSYDEKSRGLKSLVIKYDQTHYYSFSPNITLKRLTADEYKDLLHNVIQAQDFDLISAVVVDEINKFKNELVEKLPSLKTELTALSIADEEAKRKLEQDRSDREAAEAKKIEDAAANEIRAKELQLEQEKVSSQTENMMNSLAINDTVAPETRDSFKIIMLHQVAAVEIFTFWFQREGMSLTLEEIEKKSIAQMKAYCEKVAHKSNEQIVSKHLRYEPVYKAVNRK